MISFLPRLQFQRGIDGQVTLISPWFEHIAVSDKFIAMARGSTLAKFHGNLMTISVANGRAVYEAIDIDPERGATLYRLKESSVGLR